MKFSAKWPDRYEVLTREQEAQSHCKIFRQGGKEKIEWTYNNWF